MEHAARVDTLRRSPVFSGLDEGELAELSGIAVERHFKDALGVDYKVVTTAADLP